MSPAVLNFNDVMLVVGGGSESDQTSEFLTPMGEWAPGTATGVANGRQCVGSVVNGAPMVACTEETSAGCNAGISIRVGVEQPCGWTPSSPAPSLGRPNCAVTLGNKMFLFGLYSPTVVPQVCTAGVSGQVVSADTSGNVNSAERPLPAARDTFACAEVDGEAWLMGGKQDDGGYPVETIIYSATAAQRPGPPLPYPVVGASAVQCGHRLYLVGGSLMGSEQTAGLDAGQQRGVISLDLDRADAGWRDEAALAGHHPYRPGVARGPMGILVVGGGPNGVPPPLPEVGLAASCNTQTSNLGQHCTLDRDCVTGGCYRVTGKHICAEPCNMCGQAACGNGLHCDNNSGFCVP